MHARLTAVVIALAGCRSCNEPARDRDPNTDEGANDPEERDDQRDNLWRVRVTITGSGIAGTANGELACRGDAKTVTGACGPLLLHFTERDPPLIRATAASGWHFDRWLSVITEPDGSTHARTGKMPDGVWYLNGFGYSDTGQLDTVTAVFSRP